MKIRTFCRGKDWRNGWYIILFYISVIMLSGCQASVTENAAVIDDKDENVIQVCETETKTQTENGISFHGYYILGIPRNQLD